MYETTPIIEQIHTFTTIQENQFYTFSFKINDLELSIMTKSVYLVT